MKSIEIYPYIVVYKDLFKDINSSYNTLKDSIDNNQRRFFDPWTKWGSFGKYLSPVSRLVDWDIQDIDEAMSKVVGDFDENQKEFTLELMKVFKMVSDNYINRYNLNLTTEEKTLDRQNNEIPMWRRTAPVICRYDSGIDELNGHMTMRYHSDYIREPMVSPGYKHSITMLAYFNDDYEGGEIEFAIDKDLVKYKPVAGDFIIFPSGNPEVLTDGKKVYLHAVHKIFGKNNKYFLRMFWEKYNSGSKEWLDGEKEYGVEEWKKISNLNLKRFRRDNPQRLVIDGGVNLDPKVEEHEDTAY